MKIGGMGSRPTFFVSKRSPDGMWHKYGPRPVASLGLPGKCCQGLAQVTAGSKLVKKLRRALRGPVEVWFGWAGRTQNSSHRSVVN